MSENALHLYAHNVKQTEYTYWYIACCIIKMLNILSTYVLYFYTHNLKYTEYMYITFVYSQC